MGINQVYFPLIRIYRAVDTGPVFGSKPFTVQRERTFRMVCFQDIDPFPDIGIGKGGDQIVAAFICDAFRRPVITVGEKALRFAKDLNGTL